MMLVLAAPPLSPNPRTIWQLLEQGASEVLVWDGTNEVACQIHARVDRWTAIDELTEYVTSRASLAGESDCWRSLIRRIAEVGRFSDAPVLLIGESGTGKELLARVVSLVDERASKWSDDGSELVVFDCSTVVPELSGSELFGHERGAFTGAVVARDGCFALADGRTLFLDEIGELPLTLQVMSLDWSAKEEPVPYARLDDLRVTNENSKKARVKCGNISSLRSTSLSKCFAPEIVSLTNGDWVMLPSGVDL